jgi:alpha-L-fucosidase
LLDSWLCAFRAVGTFKVGFGAKLLRYLLHQSKNGLILWFVFTQIRTMKQAGFIFIASIFLASCQPGSKVVSDIGPNAVVPSQQQLEYYKLEQIGFIHFTVNTFTDKEWGYGDEKPEIFDPSQLDVEQWVLTAKAGGLRQLILTAKHHDGFCLWPSKYTEHSVKNSPYKNGKGDIVREFTDACRKHGLKAGLYLSPWDRNHKDYGKPEYISYYRNQLTELLTNYDEINEIWFDGANGGDGYYGGANEIRKIDRETYYDWDSTFSLVKKLQPNILIFSDAGPDIRWIGNETGEAASTFWSTINGEKLIIGASDPAYLNTGEPNGNTWLVGQCDVSIRPGWFYHQKEDSLVKSPEKIADIYFKSVGRNAVLLINLPPDKRGLIHPIDSANLIAFRKIIDKQFVKNLAENKKVTASNHRLSNAYFSPAHITDKNPESYWAADDSIFLAELIIDLGETISFNRILIQEPIKFGQRISKFQIMVMDETNEWKTIAEETTIGYKRILRVETVSCRKVMLKILDAINTPAISNVGLFLDQGD